jgi:predicted nucleotidyltransferase
MDVTFAVPTIDVRTRIPETVIHDLARQVAEQFHPQRIILFGSYAYGQPRPESDVDLLVIMETSLKESRQAIEIRRNIDALFGIDLLVYTPQRIAQRLKWGDSFLREIIERGIVLYESTDT